MKKIAMPILGLIALVIIIVLSSAFYVIDEREQVVITRFGKPVKSLTQKTGLHIKSPFVEEVNYFPKLLLEWDGKPEQIPTKDKRYIWVDTTARWKIVDPLRFFRSVVNEGEAQSRLDNIIEAATRDYITDYSLIEVVRDTNREMISTEKEIQLTHKEIIKKIQFGRNKVTRGILDQASKVVSEYGIELVDIRIKRINYVAEVQRKVFDRMISERRRIAEKYRSEGKGKRSEIEGEKEKELKGITSEAYKKAQEIIGKADAEATKIYASAFNKDPDFYSFTQTLDTYKDTIDENSWLIMSTDSDYFKYLKGY